MTPRPLDTDPAAWSVHNAVLDRMDGPARLRAAVELSEAVREIRVAGIQARRPGLSREEAVQRVVLDEYGVALPSQR